MFRLTATILLMFAFAVQVFNRAFVVADYYVNTGHYIEKCENKDEPDLNCEGKCQVSKKMKEEDKKEQQNPGRKGNNNEVLSSKSSYATLALQKFTIALSPISYYKLFIPTTCCSEIFHPPGLI